jgi:hypothetical protein
MKHASSLVTGYLLRSEICGTTLIAGRGGADRGAAAVLFAFAVAAFGMLGFADGLRGLAVDHAGGRQHLGRRRARQRGSFMTGEDIANDPWPTVTGSRPK